jgi:hypothetical protein
VAERGGGGLADLQQNSVIAALPSGEDVSLAREAIGGVAVGSLRKTFSNRDVLAAIRTALGGGD